MRMNSGMVISALLGKQRTHKSRQGIACRFIGSSRVIYSDRIEDLQAREWLDYGSEWRYMGIMYRVEGPGLSDR